MHFSWHDKEKLSESKSCATFKRSEEDMYHRVQQYEKLYKTYALTVKIVSLLIWTTYTVYPLSNSYFLSLSLFSVQFLIPAFSSSPSVSLITVSLAVVLFLPHSPCSLFAFQPLRAGCEAEAQ